MSEEKEKESPEEDLGKEAGKVTHYYTNLGVAIVEVSAPLKKGEEVRIKGHTTDFTQEIKSMQIDRKDIEEAKKGDVIGLKVDEHVREGDTVYKIGD